MARQPVALHPYAFGGLSRLGLRGLGIKPARTEGVGVANLVLPVVSGTPAKDATLTTDDGMWIGQESLSFTYQWYRADAAIFGSEIVYYDDQPIFTTSEPISGATANTYQLTADDVAFIVWCEVTAHRGSRTGRASSEAVGPITGFATETTALLARFTTSALAARKQAIEDCIVALKAAGVWAKLDTLYLMAAADTQAATRNWIADANNLAAVSTPTFTADRGYTTDGVASYLDFNINPAGGGTKYVQDSASAGFWSRTAGTQVGIDLGAIAGSGLLGRARNGSNQAQARVNDATSSSIGSVTDGSGLFSFVRPSSSVKQAYRNATQIGTDVAVASTVRPASIVLGQFGNANYSARQYAAGFSGSALSAVEVGSLHSALSAYLAVVGAA